MSSELLQFAGLLVVFAVALFLWFRIVYLPRRTLENWEGQRVESRDKRKTPGSDDRSS